MPYREDSVEARLLAGEQESLALVRRWIVDHLTAPRFWRLRAEWVDLTQEILARVVQSLRMERFRPEGEFKSYVQGVCRHTLQQRLQGRDLRARAVRVDEAEHPLTARDPETEAVQHQLVRRALDLSTRECRELIRAYFLEELTYEEMASRFGIPTGTVKSRLFRCLECVRSVLVEGNYRRRRESK